MNRSEIKSFRDLECWKAGRDFKLFAYGLAKKFPADEKFGAALDLRKTCRSVTQNIAEGYGRFSFQENIQFCRISCGSLYEALDLLMDCADCNYITSEEFKQSEALFERAVQLINGYINYLKRKKEEPQPITSNSNNE